MAEVTKSGTPSLATLNPPASCQLPPILAGENIAAGDACYIKSDGKAWLSTGAAATAPAEVDGFAAMAAKAGEAVTLLHDVTFNYGSGLTPGVPLFVSGTVAGGLADAASTGGTKMVARVCGDGKRIHVRMSHY